MIGGITGIGTSGMSSVGSWYQSRLAENTRTARGSARQGQLLTVRRNSSPETPVEPVRPVRPVLRDEASLPELTARLENDPAAMAGRMRTRYGSVNEEGLFVPDDGENSPVLGSRKNALEGRLFRAEDALDRNDLEGAEDVLNNGAPGADGIKLPGQEEEEEVIPGLPGQEEDGKKAVPGLPGQGEDGPDVEASGAESAREAREDGECETCEKRKYQDGSDDMGVSFKTPTNIKPEQAASAVRGHEMEHVVREQAKARREGREVVSQSVTMHTGICPECGKAFVSGGTTHTVTRAAAENDYARQADEERKPAQPEKILLK